MNPRAKAETSQSRITARKWSRKYTGAMAKALPVMKHTKVALAKKKNACPSTASTVTPRPTGSKAPAARDVRTLRTPATAQGSSTMASPERKLVRNSPSRRMGRVWRSPTLRGLYR